MKKFTRAIVRKPGRSLVDGIGPAGEDKVDYEKALVQHEAYIQALKKAGLEVIELEALEAYPDSCFVEDVALLTDRMAILTNPGAPSRNGEKDHMLPQLEKLFDRVEKISSPGFLDGGDVMMVDDYFYIGLSDRTNKEGASQLLDILDSYGYKGEMVELKEMLHLKTGVNYLDKKNLMISGEFLEDDRFEDFNQLQVPEEEGYAANSLWVNGYVLVPKGYDQVRSMIEAQGYEIIGVDTSEYKKLDGGLSCLSLRF